MNLKELCNAGEIDGHPIAHGFVVVEGQRLRLSEYLANRAYERELLPPILVIYTPTVVEARRRGRTMPQVKAEAEERAQAKEAARQADFKRRIEAQQAARQRQPQCRFDLFPLAGKE